MSNPPTISTLLPDNLAPLREAMVEKQIRRRGITDEGVLRAMGNVWRHEFVGPEFRHRAYEDGPLPIGDGQTISQPYIVAAMTAALKLTGTERVLEIGTGSGYQAAVLSHVARDVITVEFRSELARASGERLERLGYHNVHTHCGDGSLGLPELAPFDAILVSAAAPSLPSVLLQQLNEGGRMIAPVGGVAQQELLLAIRRGNGFDVSHHESCRFVPLRGRYGWKESDVA